MICQNKILNFISSKNKNDTKYELTELSVSFLKVLILVKNMYSFVINDALRLRKWFTTFMQFYHFNWIWTCASASKSLKFNLNVSVPQYWWKKRSLSDQIITSWIKNHAMTSHILTATKLVLTSCQHGWWRNQSFFLSWLGISLHYG